MKDINLNRNSYHYLLACRGGFLEWKYQDSDGYDFCEYVRKVMKGALASLLVLFVITLALVPAVHILVGIGFSLFYGMLIFTEPALIGFAIIAAISVTAAWIYTEQKWKAYRAKTLAKREQSQAPDSFMANAYDSLKNRFCRRVKLSGEIE